MVGEIDSSADHHQLPKHCHSQRNQNVCTIFIIIYIYTHSTSIEFSDIQDENSKNQVESKEMKDFSQTLIEKIHLQLLGVIMPSEAHLGS